MGLVSATNWKWSQLKSCGHGNANQWIWNFNRIHIHLLPSATSCLMPHGTWHVSQHIKGFDLPAPLNQPLGCHPVWPQYQIEIQTHLGQLRGGHNSPLLFRQWVFGSLSWHEVRECHAKLAPTLKIPPKHIFTPGEGDTGTVARRDAYLWMALVSSLTLGRSFISS